MDKYYKIESVNELLPGLECQVKSRDDEWQNVVFSPDSPFLDLLKTILWAKNVKHGEVRCKYLDEDDINCLKWEGPISQNIFEDGYNEYKQDCYRLILWDDHTVWIEDIDMPIDKEINDYVTLYRGTIKNKAQLKLIMEMIGI